MEKRLTLLYKGKCSQKLISAVRWQIIHYYQHTVSTHTWPSATSKKKIRKEGRRAKEVTFKDKEMRNPQLQNHNHLFAISPNEQMESNYKSIQAEDPIQSGLLGDCLQISKKVMLEPERQGSWVC